MIALTAYGIRKAYKKQQARKTRKEQLERDYQSLTPVDPSDDYPSTSLSSVGLASNLSPRPVSGGLVNHDQRSPLSLTRVPSASPSGCSASLYSQASYKDPLEEMRQYQAYIQRQSDDFGSDINPPTYDFVVEQGNEPTYPRKSGSILPARTEALCDMQGERHVPEVPSKVVELDSSSESPPAIIERVPLRSFRPRNPVHHSTGLTYPTAVPTDLPEQVVSPSPILYDYLQAPFNGLVAEVPPLLRIRKSMEPKEHSELPADEMTSAPAENRTGHERLQLKRPRAESASGSEIESEDNEEVIVRFNIADRTKRPFQKRLSEADYEA